MSMKMLNDISKVYLEQVAVAEGKKAKPDYLDFDKDGNKKESMKKALKDGKVSEAIDPKGAARQDAAKDKKKIDVFAYDRKIGRKNIPPAPKNVEEAVKGQDTEMRRAASAERRSGDRRLPPSKGKEFAKYKSNQISYVDKKTKGKHLPGYTYGEALEVDLKKREEANKKAIEDMKKTKAHQDMVATVRKKFEESLDPVGQEDSDIDNDGKHNTKSDKYLMNRRKVRSKAIAKESFSNWRQDLAEVMDDIESNKEIKEKKVKNKIVINPDFKEAVEQLGGELIEMVELDEETPVERIDRISKEKVAQQAAASKEERTKKATSADKFREFKKSHMAKGGTPVSAIDAWQKQKMKKEEIELEEKTLTSAETKKKEEIVKSMKKSAGDFAKRYPGRGKEVMYATATKMAKKVAEQMDDENKIDTSAERQKYSNIKMLQQKQQQLQKQKLNLQRQGKLPLNTEEYTNISESHFKVGDKVVCKDSGMKGEVVKLDKPDGAEDEKYYTVEREDGKKMKYAPNELKSAGNGGASKESETKFHTKLDKLVHKTFGSSPEEKKMKKEEVEIEEAKQSFPMKKVAKQMEKAKQGSVYAKKGNPAVPNTTDSEKKQTTRFSKMFHAAQKAKREKQEADKARRSSTFYRDTHPASASKMKKTNEEVEMIDERTKAQKVAQTPRQPRNRAFELVAQSMGAGRMGVQPRGQKKEPGKKPPSAGEYGAPESPAQKVAKRRAVAQRAKDMMHSRFD